MAYAKIADTDKLKTFSELAAALSKTFNYLSKDQRLIDLYLEKNVKYGERVRCQKATVINIVIASADQPLPVTMESFWLS